jgi:hypothetical protein
MLALTRFASETDRLCSGAAWLRWRTPLGASARFALFSESAKLNLLCAYFA